MQEVSNHLDGATSELTNCAGPLAEALARAREGWRVHPGESNKKPHLVGYPRLATATAATIR